MGSRLCSHLSLRNTLLRAPECSARTQPRRALSAAPQKPGAANRQPQRAAARGCTLRTAVGVAGATKMNVRAVTSRARTFPADSCSPRATRSARIDPNSEQWESQYSAKQYFLDNVHTISPRLVWDRPAATPPPRQREFTAYRAINKNKK